MTCNIVPEVKKIKLSAAHTLYILFTVEEYFRLIDATETSNMGRPNPNLKDLIIVAAHTVCSLGELIHKQLNYVGDDWFQVEDFKKASVTRCIRIRKHI